MALLNRGIRVAAGDTQILLNNRVFENASGTAFVTIKPDTPVPTAGTPGSYTVTLLDPGSTSAGHLRISVKHLDVLGANNKFAFVIETLGSTVQAPIETAPINYTDEATLGLSWNATTGQISYVVASADRLVSATQTSTITAFTAGITTTTSGLGNATTLDAPLAINNSQFNGFIDKFASYSNVMVAADLERYVLDPANLPTTNRLLLLDGTSLASAERFDASIAEVQQMTFGPALNSGVITVGGARTVVLAGDSGATIAEKVRASLAENNLYKPQLEKQTITFTGTAATTSMKVAGVSVTLVIGDTEAIVAGKVKSALDGSTFITSNAGRSVQDNGNGSLTITFNNSDADTRPIAIDSLSSTIKASVDTVQTYNATGNGRKLSVSGAALSIALNPADMNALDLALDLGGTGVSVTDVRTGVANHNRESTSFVPSQFSFTGTPVGELQRYLVTTGADADGGDLSIAGGVSATTVSFAAKVGGYTLAETASQIATTLQAAVTANTITNVTNVIAVGDYVEIQFKPTAGNVAAVTVSEGGTATGVRGRVLTSQQYAQNLPGEAQTVHFTAATAAGNMTIDGVTVAVALNDTATSVANKVLTKLVASGTADNGLYSTPEVQMITFLTGATGAGNINVNGTTVALLVTDDTPAEVATKVVTALNAVATPNYTAVLDGDSVRVTFHNAAGDAALLTGLSIPSTGGATGVTATTFSTIQEYNANGKRTTKVNADGSLTIEFAPYEGNVDPVLFTDTGTTGVTASVATTREANAVKLTSSSYTGNVSAPTDNTLPASNAIYTQLVSTESGVAGKTAKKLSFDVYVDPVIRTLANQVGTGYETVDFTMNYSTNDFAPGSINVVLAQSSGGSPIFNTSKPGEVVVRWLDTSSITDFTKPVARITLDQLPVSGVFRDSVDFTFSNLNVDGVDFSDGTRFARTYTDTLNTDRWDVKQKLVHGLDGTTAIGGQLVGYYGSPGVTGRQLELKFKDMKDPGTATTASLTNPDKLVTMDVVNAEVTGLRTVKFAIELPSNASATTFTLSTAATAAGLKLSTVAGAVNGVQGRTLFVTLDGGNASGLARGANIGTVSTELDNARDLTHEFSFASGSISFTNATTTASGTGKSLYVGYTATANDNLTLGQTKGDWLAKDMPRGEFTKFFVDTAPTNASRVITAADALQILKLSAYFDLDWKSGAPPMGAFAAADLDGSGKVTSNDALIALRYATGLVPTSDPVKWRFYDSATTSLGVEETRLQVLKAGMPVGNSSEMVEITAANSLREYFTQAILVGNLTNPALDI